MTHSDYILIAYMPSCTLTVNWIEHVNVCAHQASRMISSERFNLSVVNAFDRSRKITALTLTYKHWSVGEFGQRDKTFAEVFRLTFKSYINIDRKRIGVDSGHKKCTAG